jgi:arabinofuranosyltransferase
MPWSDTVAEPGTPVGQRALATARVAAVVPFLVLTGWMIAVGLHASVVVNGGRVFYLDDVEMVGMRYGRNLADGLGLVWNAGERVEGFTNPAWVLTMAAVHAAGAPDTTAALFIKAIAWMLACGVLALSAALRRQLSGPDPWADVALLAMLAMNADVVFWAANGFETPLLTALLLWLLTRVIHQSERRTVTAGTMVAVGALGLVRSDAYLLIAAVAAVAIFLSPERGRTARLALLAVVLPLLLMGARLAYYGQWMPNTFELHMTGVPDLLLDGLRYVKRFCREYWFLITCAVAACARPRDWRTRAVGAVCVITALHAVAVGGDFLVPFRFIAPVVPLIMTLAVITAQDVRRYGRRRGAIALAMLATAGIVSGGMLSRWPVEAMRSWRGKPWQGAAIGLLMAQGSRSSATVAAAGGGALGYFSRRTVIDLAGRTDPSIARLPARRGADASERKFDIEMSLRHRPDFVLTAGPHEAALRGEVMFALSGVDPERDIGPAIVAAPTFQRLYRDGPIPIEPLLRRSAVYVRADSPERARMGSWRLDVTGF